VREKKVLDRQSAAHKPWNRGKQGVAILHLGVNGMHKKWVGHFKKVNRQGRSGSSTIVSVEGAHTPSQKKNLFRIYLKSGHRRIQEGLAKGHQLEQTPGTAQSRFYKRGCGWDKAGAD